MRQLLDGAALCLHRHGQREGGVGHRVRRQFHAPGAAQPAKSGAGKLVAGAEHIPGHGSLRRRVDKENGSAAAQEVLVDQPFLAARQRRRMRQKQHVRILGNEAEILRQRIDLEAAGNILQEHIAACRIRRAHAGQGREYGDTRRLGMIQARDHPRQVIFQRQVLLRREEGQDAHIVDRVVTNDAEIERIIAARRNRRNAGRQSFVLCFGERRRINLAHADLPAGGGLIGGEQFAHARRMRLYGGEILPDTAGVNEGQVHRLADLVQRRAGRVRQRVKPAFGEIDPRAGQQFLRGDVARQQDHAGQQGGEDKVLPRVHLDLHPSLWREAQRQLRKTNVAVKPRK